MSLRCLTKLVVALAFASVPAMAEDAKPLRICAEPDNLPLSQQSSNSGFEIEVAQLLAKDLGRPLQVKWVAQRDPSFLRSTIGAGLCDAVMSIPSGFTRLATTRPWYRSSFVFVTRRDENLNLTSFDDAALQKLTIGVPSTGQGETPPALALTRRALGANLRPYAIYQPAAMIGAVADRSIDVAVVWGPFAGWYASEEKVPMTIAATPATDGQMSMAYDISIGVAKGSEALRDQLDAALAHERPAIAAILKRWRIPVRES